MHQFTIEDGTRQVVVVNQEGHPSVVDREVRGRCPSMGVKGSGCVLKGEMGS